MNSDTFLMRFSVLLLILLLGSCAREETRLPENGRWRAVLEVQDEKELPFIFEFNGKDTIVIANAEERIVVDELEFKGDSVRIQLPVYEGFIVASFTQHEMKGSFIKSSLNRIVPFRAEFGQTERFSGNQRLALDVHGNYETVFSPQTDSSYVALGSFQQSGGKVTGTFRTTTGDYRYLEGIVDGDVLKLSTFDGAHAFLFEATISGDSLRGVFYSGNHWKEPFHAVRNANYELPNPEDLTFLKEGYKRFAFSFPDEKGALISLEDLQFKQKVTLVQIMGSWCPNCLDESKFLVNYLQQNPNEELEVVAIAFEYAPTAAIAFQRIQRLKERIGITYPVLLAQHGTSDKLEANKKLPMLNHILSYPTTIFIDKRGEVRKIHTGFNGPATGEKYEEFAEEFTAFVDLLLAE